jgi:uracil-DNA glycosylase family 4
MIYAILVVEMAGMQIVEELVISAQTVTERELPSLRRQIMDKIGENSIAYPMYQLNKNCMLCDDLVTSRNRITWGYGNIKSPVMFIGEAPGMHGCDITGIPFTLDKSGEYFQSMLKSVGWVKEQVYVTNIVKCCPAGNRTPTIYEITSCNKFLAYEIAKVDPKYIIVMGKPAMKVLLDKEGSIINLWDKIFEKDGRKYYVLPHPAFIVRDKKHWESYYLKSFIKIRGLVNG